VAAVLFSACVAAAQTASPDTMGADLGNQAQTKYGTGAGATTLTDPMLSGGARQLSTFGGGTSFIASVSCPATDSFMEVSILPASSGDLSTVVVRQDTDMNGSYDYSYGVPFLVSGVCANGLISCTAGTWSNCSYYKWTAASGKVSVAPAQQTELGGCFCINNSCGTGLVANNLVSILQALGGGAVAAVQGTNPQYAVSKVEIQDLTAVYYGQKSADCSAAPSGVTGSSGSPTSTYNPTDAGSLQAAAQNQTAIQSGTPDSYYNLMQEAAQATQTAGSSQNCTIKQVVYVNTQKQSPSYQWRSWLDITVTCHYGRDSINSCDAVIKVDKTRDGAYDAPDDSKSWGCCWTSAADIVTVGRNLADQCVAQEQQAYSVPASEIRKVTGSESFAFYDGGGKGSHGNVTIYKIKYERISPPICPAGYQYNGADTMCYYEPLVETVSDACSSLQTDPQCSLQSETVDGVRTFRNYNPTGLTPLPSCKDFSGVMESYNVCRDWWVKDRVYFCQTGSAYDFSDAKRRSASINTTARDSVTALTYVDERKTDGGAWTSESNTINLTPRGTVDCTQACKLTRPATNTQAGTSGNTTQYQTSNASVETVYRQCMNGACPAEPGETVVKNCQCINDFAESAAIMETMASAAKDMICSNGLLQ
jgi:hypothetical protein